MSSPSKSKVYFFFQHKGSSLKNRTQLKLYIERIFKKERKKLYQMNYIFCSDKQLLEINRKYLGKDYYTDIITFDLSDNKSYVRGESYISIERARDNAKALAIPFSAELHRVVFHGALHLCGYEDNTKKNILLMRKKEDYYLSLYKQGLFDLV